MAHPVRLFTIAVILVLFFGACGKTDQPADKAAEGNQPASESSSAAPGSTATPAPAAAAETQPLPPPPPPPIVVQAGTVLAVRTVQKIDVDTAQAGATFPATIDEPVVVGDKVAVREGAEATLRAVKVQQSGKMKGKDLIQLELASIVIDGKSYQVRTTFKEIASEKTEGKSTRRKIIGGAAVGTAIGAIAGGGKGAAIGAAVGGGAGTAMSAAGEQHLKVPAETRLDFKLESDLTI